MGQYTLAPICSICLASTYSEFAPANQQPDWLSKVRLVVNKDDPGSRDPRMKNALEHLPVDMENFEWSHDIIITPNGVATSWFGYETDRITLCWSESDHGTTEPPVLRPQIWDLADGMDNFKSIHESCFILLVDMLKYYATKNEFEVRCSARSLWDWLCDESLATDDSVPNIPDLSWQTSLFIPEEKDLWKYTDPLPLDLERHESIANALNRVLQLQPEHRGSVNSKLEDDSRYHVESWPALWHLLKRTHSDPERDDIFTTIPSLRNRVRISERIEKLIPKLWELETKSRALAAQKSTWARLSYTLGLPEPDVLKTLFIRNSASDNCFRIQACILPGSNELSGIRFWYRSSLDTAPATSRTLGTWCDGQEDVQVEINGTIIGVVLCFNKPDYQSDNLRNGHHYIIGLRFEFDDTTESKTFGSWKGNAIQYLRPGENCVVTGFRYSVSPEGTISQILLLEANQDESRAPQSPADILRLYRESPPLLRNKWPLHMPMDLHIGKAIGMDSPRYNLNRTEIFIMKPSDPVVQIRIAPQVPQNILEFTTLSGDIQYLPSLTNTTSIDSFSLPASRTFGIDAPSENIVSIQLTYVHYWDEGFPTLDMFRFHGRVTEPELVDVVFTTNLGRSSREVRERGLGIDETGDQVCTFVLEAGDGDEIAGIYMFGYSWITMFHGLLTRKKGSN